MADYLKTTSGDLTIRACGSLFLVLSWVAVRALLRLAASVPSAAATPIGCLLATIGFLAASAGAAALLIGRHLLAEIEVSQRWRRHDAGKGPYQPFAALAQGDDHVLR